MQFVSILILAFAVSLDSFGVGVTYGLRKVYIPLFSILIIAMCSGVTIILAMMVGQGISFLVSRKFTEMLGGLILIGIGTWAFLNNFRNQQRSQDCTKEQLSTSVQETKDNPTIDKRIWTIEFKKLGIVIQILRKPMMADIDRSGVISSKEALVLGIALSLDAFGAGIGAALLGYSPWLVALMMGFMSSTFVFIGMKLGTLLAQHIWTSKLQYVPAFILILFGFFKII